MTRLGWVILIVILAATGVFLSMLSFGPSAPGGLHDRVRQIVPFVRHRPAPGPGGLVIPVAGYPAVSLQDSWGDVRGGGARAHHGTDLMAARGTLVIAAASGRVEKLFQSHDGGTTVYIRSPDRLWSYYYAHLAGYAPGIHEGQQLRAGDPVGFVGDSGNAGPGNTHLHFGMSRMRSGEGWWGGEPIDPYPLLAGRRPGR